MSRRDELFDHVRSLGIVAVIREDSAEDAWELGRCFAENGLSTIEVTMTTPDAAELIGRLRERYADRGVVLAAGTVRSTDEAAAARRAGAVMLVSPHTDLRVVEYAIEHDMLCVAGAATATEIIRAWEAGASIIKIYPARQLGGPDYIRTIRQPIRGIPMLAGGPVGVDEIETYLESGAIAVNLGAALAPPALVRAHDWGEIAKIATRAVAIARSWVEGASDAYSVVH